MYWLIALLSIVTIALQLIIYNMPENEYFTKQTEKSILSFIRWIGAIGCFYLTVGNTVLDYILWKKVMNRG